mmetsp:Transcript_13213/g.38315  ORF Transcript_13213/g.38315 Transcript_13213/m.38315 type:complete len:208 (-) Transcript_13213:304-927(-)
MLEEVVMLTDQQRREVVSAWLLRLKLDKLFPYRKINRKKNIFFFNSYEKYLLLDHHLDKLVIVDLTITVKVGLLDHFLDLFLCELLTKVGHDVSQFSGGDESISVLVENLESFHQFFLRVGILHLLGHQTQKLSEINSTTSVVIDFIDHIVQFSFCWGLTKRTHNSSQLLSGNGAIAVLVEEQERFLEFGNLFVRELRGGGGLGHGA